MITRFTTAHGSTYEIDDSEKTWKQLDAGQDTEGDGFDLRSTQGPYFSVSSIVEGQRVNIWAPPFVEGAVMRVISTSPVVTVQTEGF